MIDGRTASLITDGAFKRLNLFRRSKPDAVEMRILAKAFGVAALLGADVPGEESFIESWYTTLGPIVYVPGGDSPGVRSLRVMTHEGQHGAQFWKRGAQFANEYVSSAKWRALFELDAEVARWELEHYLCGELPSAEEIATVTRHGYAINEDLQAFTESAANQRLVLVSAGKYTTRSGSVFVEECKRHGVKQGAYGTREALLAAP